MSAFCIRTFDGRPDTFAESPDHLANLLELSSKQYDGHPTLVNIYDGDDRISVIGLGASFSTLQCVDKRRGISSRVIADIPRSDDLTFSYQSQATHISPKYLIDVQTAIRVAVTWLSQDQLSSDVKWISHDYRGPRKAS